MTAYRFLVLVALLAMGFTSAFAEDIEKDAGGGAGYKAGYTVALHQALDKQKKGVALVLLEHGADPNGKDSAGTTPLRKAAAWGDAELIGVLLKKGAKVNAVSPYGDTALHRSARGWSDDSDAVVSLLLAHGAEVDSRDAKGMTPLMIAVGRVNRGLAEKLLAKGADVNAVDNLGRSVLMRALMNPQKSGYREMGRWLIANGAEKNDLTAVFEATLSGDLAALKALITKQPTLLAGRESRYSETPLEVAIRVGQNHVVALLIEMGADPNAGSSEGRTALHMAAIFRRAEILDLLIEKGADVNAADDDGRTPLFMANNLKPVADVLIRKGADVNHRDKEQKTPLHHLFTPDVMSALIAAGADLNAKDKDDLTPLHHAVYLDLLEAGALLIKHGADVNLRDNSGWTPLRWAEQQQRTSFISLLKKHGARK